MDQQQQQHQRQSRTAAKENLKVAANDQVVTVATEELVRLEVSYFYTEEKLQGRGIEMSRIECGDNVICQAASPRAVPIR